MTLDADFSAKLSADRDVIVPVVGAGLAREAGMPDEPGLAAAFAEAAGADLGAVSLEECAEQIAEARGEDAMHELAAEVLAGFETRSTPVLELLARCPTRRLVTTNYDDAVELAVKSAGLTPVSLQPTDVESLRQPKAREVHVIHIHGSLADRERLIVSRSDRQRAMRDPHYAHFVSHIASSHRLLFLGFRLGENEVPLRTQLQWVQSLYRSEDPHLLLLPAGGGRSDLDQMIADQVVDVCWYELDPDHKSVGRAALILAPRAVTTEHAFRCQVDPEALSDYFTPPVLIRREGDKEDNDPKTAAILAELYGGVKEVTDLPEAQRSLLVAPPGFGKSEALLRCGTSLDEGSAIYASFCSLPAQIEKDEDFTAAFARFLVQSGRAFDGKTRPPTIEALADSASSFTLLLDAFDEVAVPQREAVIRTVFECAREWPHHTYVIASRPVAEIDELRQGSFVEFNLVESQSWGQRYLENRGVDKETIEALLLNAASLGSLISIPQYAKDLGELLVSGEAIPETTVELILGRQRAAIAVQSSKAGRPTQETYDWVQRLAVALELRGENSAPVSELAQIPGQGPFSVEERRELLIRSTLLRDIPDEAQFASGVVQEALCAEAILSADDPVATLRAVALADVGGEEIFRADTEHMVDLVFEAAGDELRRELRGIDPIRWARTQAAHGRKEDIEAALRMLRDFYFERRLWRAWRQDNQLRGSARTFEVLNAVQPEILTSWKEELIAETTSEERTVRGNAIDLLRVIGADESTARWLLPLVADGDPVVRRIAANAVGELRPEGAYGALASAWTGESDELALEAIGTAILELTGDEDLATVLPLLANNHRGWSRLGFWIKERVTPQLLPVFFATEGLSVDEKFDLVDDLLKNNDVVWSDSDVGALAEWVMRNIDASYKLRRSERLAELCRRHPDAALAGAERGVPSPDGLRGFDVHWLLEIDVARLEAAIASGSALPLKDVVEMRKRAHEVALPVPDPLASQPDDGLEDLLVSGAIDANSCPDPWALRGELNLSEEGRGRLAELADAWYPGGPITDHVTPPNGRRTINNGLHSALLAFAALKVPLDKERWFELFETSAFAFGEQITEWAKENYDPAWSQDAAEVIAGFESTESVGMAADVIGEWDESIADAFAASFEKLDDDFVGKKIIRGLCKTESTSALAEIARAASSGELRHDATVELARLGDVPAQLRLLGEIQKKVAENPAAHEHRGLEWIDGAVDEELLPALIQLVRTAWEAEDAHFTMRAAAGSIERIAGEDALAIYDGLIADPTLHHGQFLWHNRNEFARDLARRKTLESLPTDRAELVAVVDPSDAS